MVENTNLLLKMVKMEETEKMANHQKYLFVTIMMEHIQLQSLIQMEVKQKQWLKMEKMANHQLHLLQIMEMELIPSQLSILMEQ